MRASGSLMAGSECPATPIRKVGPRWPLAAATTAGPKRSPGRRLRRSTGPDTLTAARTVAVGRPDRRAHRGHPGLPLLDRRHPGPRSPRARIPREHVAGGATVEGQEGALGDDPAQPVRRLERQDAPPLLPSVAGLDHVELHGLAGLVAQLLERLAGQHPQRPGVRRGLAEARSAGVPTRSGPRRRVTPARAGRAPRPAGAPWPGAARWPPPARRARPARARARRGWRPPDRRPRPGRLRCASPVRSS